MTLKSPADAAFSMNPIQRGAFAKVKGTIIKYGLPALVAVAVIVIVAVLGILHQKKQNPGEQNRNKRYTPISQEEAKTMMEKDDGHIIVDVRQLDEYEGGHIPGAICIPNESIGSERPEELPDLDQIILVYCRSGRRSKEAAQKLCAIGYTNIYEFGGILDWTGEITVDKTVKTERAVQPRPVLVVEANGKKFYATIEDNSSGEALIEKLTSAAITLQLHDYGHFEKVGALPWELPRNDEQITTAPGDIILYQGNQITLYYDKNTWSFTRLGKIGNATREELLAALGDGDVSVRFSLEWSE